MRTPKVPNNVGRGVDYIANYLSDIGVKYVFGVGGANIEDLFDAIKRCNKEIKCILAKSEFGATCMAFGYAQINRDLGVVITTAGGAALNTVPALGEVFNANIPLLAILGQPVGAAEGKGVFQDTSGLGGTIDGQRLFATIAKKCVKANTVTDLPEIFTKAATVALTEPMGDVVILLRKDLQQAQLELTLTNYKLSIKTKKLSRTSKEKIRDFIERVVVMPQRFCTIISGSEMNYAENRTLLVQLVDKLDAKVTVTPTAKSSFDNRNDHFVGVSGVIGHPSVKQAIEASNFIIILGSRMDMLSYVDIADELAGKKILYINHCQPHLAFLEKYHKDITVTECNVTTGLNFLLKELKDFPTTKENAKSINSLVVESARSFHQLPNFNSLEIFKIFNRYIEEDASVFIDAGNVGAAALHYLLAPKNGFVTVPLSMGGMGFAIGSAIGAAFKTEKKVYLFVGDGSFLINGLEIHTAIEHNLPVVFVIFNNNAHAMCYTREKLYYGGDYTYNLFKPSLYGEGLKKMFPTLALSEDISDLTRLNECLQLAAAITTPVVLSLNVDPEEMPSFYPLLQSYKQQQGGQS